MLSTTGKILTFITLSTEAHFKRELMRIVLVLYLVKEGAVRDGNSEGGEASSQHHVVRSIIAVAAASAGKQPGHGCPAEHHPTHEHTEGSV